MAIDLLAQQPKDLLSGEPKDLLSPQSDDALTRLETAFSGPDFGLFSHPIEIASGKSNEQRAVEAFSKPATSRPFDQNLAGAPTALSLAALGDNVTSPINLLPIPTLEAGGALLEGVAPGAAKWLAKQTKNINPRWNAELNPTAVASPIESNIVKAITPPVMPPVTDQNPAYQAWLQKNAQPSGPQNPLMDVPLHPADEGRAALAQIPEELPNQGGQLGFRNFPQAPVSPQIPANTGDYLAAIQKYEDSLSRAKADKGQQQFDFTQGPTPTTQEIPAAAQPTFPVFKNTGAALEFGKQSKDNPAIIQLLKEAYDSGLAKVAEVKQLGEKATDQQISEAFTLAQKNQLYREAYEAATGTGASKTESPAPPWVKEAYAQQVKDKGIPPHPFIDADLNNPSVVNAIKNDPSLSAAQKAAILSKRTGGTLDSVLGKPPVSPKTVQLPGKQLGFSDIINKNTLKMAPESVPQIPEGPLPFPESPNQQQFDFTKGPQESLADLRMKLKNPNLSDAEFAQVQQQIRDALVPDRSNTIIKEPIKTPVAEAPILSSKPKRMSAAEKALRLEKKQLFDQQEDWTPQQEARLKEIDRQLVKKQPSALEDLGTIVKGLNNKGSTGGGRFTPEGEAAIQRFRTQHAAELAEHLKIAGNTVEGFLAKKVPTLSALEIKELAHYMTPQKLGNSNISLQNMSPENAVKAKDIAANNFVDLAKSNKGEPLTRAESIGRAGTEGAQQTADALSNINTRDAASGMSKLGLEANQALEDIVGKNASPESIQKANDALESFKRAGTAAGRLLQSRKNILANAQEFVEQSRILYSNGSITKESLQAIEEGATKLRELPKPAQETFWRRLHELGVNNMLSVMSNFRNITGNVLSVPFAPLDRLVQGGINAAVGRPLNRLAETIQKGVGSKTNWKPFKGTEVVAREAGQMVKSYMQTLPTGLKMGGRYFLHETDSAVYKSIAKDISNVTKDTTLSPQVKASKLAALEKQRAASLETIQGEHSGETNLSEQVNLTHRRAIPGPIGYIINTPARALTAMDQVFRIPLRQGADDAIRLRLGIKAGIPWKDIKLAPEQANEGAYEAAYYTFNQSLGSFGKKVQAAIQPKTALGYAAGNVLVFMKNAVNIGKWALDHGALTTGSALLDPMIGPLLNRATQKGTHIVDTKALAKSLAGLGVAYTSYAMMKKAGWNFYLNSNPDNFDEATQRRVAGLPVDLFAKDGSGNIHSLSELYPMTFFFQKMAAWDTAQRLASRGVPSTDRQWSNWKNQADVFMDASTLTGTKDILSAWDNALKQGKPSMRAADEVNPITKYLSKQAAARLTSAFLDEVNRMYFDKTQRSPNTPADYFMARTPGLSQNVPAKVDWTGKNTQKLPVYSPLREMVIGRGNVKSLDPVQQELVRLGVFPTPVAKSADGIRFTNAERDKVLRTYGPIALNTVKSIMADPGYSKMPEFMKYSMLTEALKVQNAGEKQLVGEHALADMNKFFNLQLYKNTKGRSISEDTSNAEVFPR